ncbi:hypothetical protein EON83_04660 [bacterium]|nr:MAG: hypothetical protein EON83_04660 [bacterium]
MLKNFLFTRRRVVTVAALLGACYSSLPLCAQENPTTATPTAETLKQLQKLTPGTDTQLLIPVRNVRASLVAYWLDSRNQDKPLDLRMGQRFSIEEPFGKLPRFPGNANGPADLKLPEGITRIVAVDPQNSIIAFGTKEGVQALADLIPTLDVPLVQYEIEAQFLQISRADLPELHLNFGEYTEKNPTFIGAVAGVRNIYANLARLIAGGKMQVLTAPRVTVIDGLSAQLQQSTVTPFVLNQEALKKSLLEKPEEGTVRQSPSAEMLQATAYVTTSIGLKTTVHQNKDDLISLSVNPMFGTRTVSVAATVRDGESFAIQLSPANEDKQVIVLVTTRRIRRVGDDDAK